MSVSKKWLEVLKKNDIEFQKNSNKENIIPLEEDIHDNNKNSLFYRCPDEEFNIIYNDKMIDIKSPRCKSCNLYINTKACHF